MKIRSFLAFDLPSEVKNKLGTIINDFSQRAKKVIWTNPDNFHVTLRFFADVEEELLMGDLSRRIKEAVTDFQKIDLVCSGIGVFPNWRYPKVIWAGFKGDTEKAIQLKESVDRHLDGLELPDDKRKFRLHLTLGRVRGSIKKSGLVELVEKLGPVEFGKAPIEKLVLYKSLLTKEGAIYTPLNEFDLK